MFILPFLPGLCGLFQQPREMSPAPEELALPLSVMWHGWKLQAGLAPAPWRQALPAALNPGAGLAGVQRGALLSISWARAWGIERSSDAQDQHRSQAGPDILISLNAKPKLTNT